jgi:hypothetical protein
MPKKPAPLNELPYVINATWQESTSQWYMPLNIEIVNI